ncbi:MAG: aldo/keto reductase [Balneolaceae bacterium]|nr:aldo/keto reductase [Balneolaceae bacterium]MCH8549358.1 aldo/keto reductase [Balneolaceae bacterium]
MKKLTFRDGDKIPAIGLGTWKSDPGKVGDAVSAALETGYRHIDCAAIYGNEAEIGEALQKSYSDLGISRKDVWLTSKLWNREHKREDVIPALKQTLSDLQTDYLDLYLIHWPVAFRPDLEGFPRSDDDYLPLSEVPLTETWDAMLEAKKQGLIRHAGVSNFSIKKLKELIRHLGEDPEMNQVELHPYLQQKELLKFCKEKGILLTSYSPLGSGDRPERLKKEGEPTLLDNEVILSIAEKQEATPAQVLIQWAVARGTCVIPKSTNPGRIDENFNSKEVDLDEEDMEQIESLDIHFRYLDGTVFETESEMYRDIFDEG